MARGNQSDSSLSAARSRLAALGEKRPHSKAAQLRLLWPEIRAALDRGHTLKAVCECLEADGLKMSVYSLGSYVTRMRRKSAQSPALPPSALPISVAADALGLGGERGSANASIERDLPDPLANVRKGQSKRAAFDYRPELADPDKLI